MSTHSSEDEGDWALVNKAGQDSGEESCSSSEFVKVDDTAFMVSYHHKSCSHGNHELYHAEVDGASPDLCDESRSTAELQLNQSDRKSRNLEMSEADSQLANLMEQKTTELETPQGANNCNEDNQTQDAPQVNLESESVDPITKETSMFASLGERSEDQQDDIDRDRFIADFLGRSGMELRRHGSSSDSDSDFVRIEPHAIAENGNIMTGSGSSVGSNFQFIPRPRDEDEDSLPPGGIDDRCESDLSMEDDTEDLSSMSNAVADIPMYNIPVIRNYRQKPNSNLNKWLSVVAACVLCMAIGLGIGHAIGSVREASLQSEIRQGQQERLRVLQDDLLMCLQKQEEMDGTIVKLNEIEKLLKDADYWRNEYEDLLKIKLKNEDNWKREKELPTEHLSELNHRHRTPPTAVNVVGNAADTERILLAKLRMKEEALLALRTQLNLQKAITDEHVQRQSELEENINTAEDEQYTLATKVSILRVENENLHEKLEEEIQDDLNMESTITNLQNENNNLRVELDEEAQDDINLNVQIVTLKEKLQKLSQEMEFLKFENVKLKAKLTPIATHIQHIYQLRDQLNALTLENQALKSDLVMVRYSEHPANTNEPLTFTDNSDPASKGEESLYSTTATPQSVHAQYPSVSFIKQSPLGKQSPVQQDTRQHSADYSNAGIYYMEREATVDELESLRKQFTEKQEQADLLESELARTSKELQKIKIEKQELERHFQDLQVALRSAQLFKMLYLKEKSQQETYGKNDAFAPSFLDCMAMIWNNTQCNNNLLCNLTHPLHEQWQLLVNMTFDSQFTQYFKHKHTEYTSSPKYKDFKKTFNSAYDTLQNSVNGYWSQFKDLTSSEMFEESSKTVKQTANKYWEMFNDYASSENLKHATKRTGETLSDVKNRVVETMHDTVNGIHNSTKSPQFQKYVNKTKKTVSELSSKVQQTWKQLKNLSDQFLRQHGTSTSVVSDTLSKFGETISDKWKQFKDRKRHHHRHKHDHNHESTPDKKPKHRDFEDIPAELRSNKKFNSKLKKLKLDIKGMNAKKVNKMKKDDVMDMYEKLEDFREDYEDFYDSYEKHGKPSWLTCQMNWWKSIIQKRKDEVELKGCNEKIMAWQKKVSKWKKTKCKGKHHGKERKKTSVKKTLDKSEHNKTDLATVDSESDKKHHNTEWYFQRANLHKRRNGKEHNADWMFRRANLREYHHHKTKWVFDRAWERDFQRTMPDNWYFRSVKDSNSHTHSTKHQQRNKPMVCENI